MESLSAYCCYTLYCTLTNQNLLLNIIIMIGLINSIPYLTIFDGKRWSHLLHLYTIKSFCAKLGSLKLKRENQTPSVGGIAVSIAAFQAVDPDSTPGHRNCLLMS